MKDTEIINYYNNLDQYAKDRIDRQLIDLTNAHQKPCILISEQTMNMYFPIRGKDNPENVFVYFNIIDHQIHY